MKTIPLTTKAVSDLCKSHEKLGYLVALQDVVKYLEMQVRGSAVSFLPWSRFLRDEGVEDLIYRIIDLKFDLANREVANNN